MDTADLPLHLMDLRRVPPEQLTAATAVCAQSLTPDLDPCRAFDALVPVRHITPASEILRTLQDSVAHDR